MGKDVAGNNLLLHHTHSSDEPKRMINTQQHEIMVRQLQQNLKIALMNDKCPINYKTSMQRKPVMRKAL